MTRYHTDETPSLQDTFAGNGFSALPDSPSLEQEIAEYLPSVEPTDEQLQAEYLRHYGRSLMAATAAGIFHGFRTNDCGTFEGFVDLPGGERVYTGKRVASMSDADDEAVLLAGRLAAELAASAIPSAEANAA